MTARTTRRLAWTVWTVSIVVGLLSLPLQISGGLTLADVAVFVPVSLVMVVGFSTVGLLIASRQSRNAIGWIFLAVGLTWSASGLAQGYAYYALVTQRTASMLARLADWSGQWNWMPLTFLAPILIALLFPDGKPLDRRWRPVTWLAVVATVLITFTTAIAPGPLEDPVFLNRNPFALRVPGTAIVNGVSALAMLLAFALSMVSVVIRFRRSRGDERQQMKWLVSALVVTVSVVATGFLIGGIIQVDSTSAADQVLIAIILSSLAFIPVAAGIAILKYRLYDIDVVINRTVVFGALAAFITLAYVGIVVGIGSAIGERSSVGLSIAATAFVALAFHPVQVRIQRFANRVVYGTRATPYEVMTDFAHRIAGTLTVEDALPQLAEAAARGVGAGWSRVRLVLPGDDIREVRWPEGSGDEIPTREIPVTNASEPIGSIAVAKPAGEPITPAEERLLEDLATQAGIALRNVRLTVELEQRLDEIAERSEQLKISRQRLVTARDAQRRQLERDIREGAQGQLLDIGSKLQAAAACIEEDPDRAIGLLDDLGTEANAALEGLRDLARGIFPPLLAEEGILAALEAHVRKTGVRARIEVAPGTDSERFGPDTEAAIYFCCVQALQNVARHAGETDTTVRIARRDGSLEFTVEDHGVGFDPAATPKGMGLQIMFDRVEALGGTLDVQSAPGRGTRVSGRVPVREEAVIT
ncbi:MAG TPA: ATP-binding protein [Actinomycetota bacterium]|nr:ATP-binding protein [Actinomycetota bacterium]